VYISTSERIAVSVKNAQSIPTKIDKAKVALSQATRIQAEPQLSRHLNERTRWLLQAFRIDEIVLGPIDMIAENRDHAARNFITALLDGLERHPSADFSVSEWTPRQIASGAPSARRGGRRMKTRQRVRGTVRSRCLGGLVRRLLLRCPTES
jgi:hypothetical protein